MWEAHEVENYFENVLFWGFKLILFRVSPFSYSRSISKNSRSWSKVLTGGVVRFRDSIVIKKRYWHKKKHVDQRNSIKDPYMNTCDFSHLIKDPYMNTCDFSHLIFDKDVKSLSRREESNFDKRW